jgi:hypothetical protein
MFHTFDKGKKLHIYMPHNFYTSLEHEKTKHAEMDAFYFSEKFKAKKIIRYNTDSKADMEFQLQDIDCSITMHNSIELHVSEKYRRHDYGDLLLEMYSKYPQEVGWVHKSKADRMAYFTLEKMYWIEATALHKLCMDKIFKQIENTHIEKLLHENNNSVNCVVQLDKKYNCKLTQAPNQVDNNTWNTISIAMPIEALQNNGVRLQIFKR